MSGLVLGMTSLLPTVTVAVTPAPLPENFSVPQAVALARDLVIQMYDRATILKMHKLTDAQALTLEQNDYFKKLMHELAIEWNAPKSAQDRLAVQTAVGLETVLPAAIARISIKNEPLAGVAQLVKVLADIAGANATAKQKGPPGEKFTITINIGEDKDEVYHKTKPVIEVHSDAAPAAGESEGEQPAVRALTEGAAALFSLQLKPE
jgi:hypothetical protein